MKPRRAEDRPFPHNLEAERAVLGAILLNDANLHAVLEALRMEDFFHRHHRRIFDGMMKLAERHKAIDLLTLTEELRRKDELEEVGGAAYLASLVDGVPHISNVSYYARIVKEKAALRRAAYVGQAISQAALGGDHEAALVHARSLAETKTTGAVAVLWVAEGMDAFLTDDEVDAEPLYEPLLYPETVTEIFSPRGIGKSIFALDLATRLARSGKRVILLDRDNPRRVIRQRLRALGAGADLATLKVISREKCPALTRADLWAQFPCEEYDVVILDSFDALAEGIGEQDSGKPSRAIAPILDIARRERGPAVLVLGNCVRTGRHSRGSGVIEDRADLVFEVRDATDLHPTGSKPWVEELPAQGAGDWVARSSRRKLREQFRLAFICTKGRPGVEPEPFIVEVDTTLEPWSLRDVTDEVDQEGAEGRERRAREKADAVGAAIVAMREEIVRREEAGEGEPLKSSAEAFLMGRGFKRGVARDALASAAFRMAKGVGKGHPKTVRIAGKNQSPGGNEGAKEPAKILSENDVDFRSPHGQGTAETDLQKPQYSCGLEGVGISAVTSIPPSSKTGETRSPGGVEEGEV